MSSRGSKAENGHITTDEYETERVTQTGVKILKGRGSNHSLPDYAHTPGSIYAKMEKDGVTLREMRFYDDKGYPIIEIAYHREKNIKKYKTEKEIVHFHYYDGLDRKDAQRMDGHPEIKEKYAIYLKEFNLYDKC